MLTAVGVEEERGGRGEPSFMPPQLLSASGVNVMIQRRWVLFDLLLSKQQRLLRRHSEVRRLRHTENKSMDRTCWTRLDRGENWEFYHPSDAMLHAP